MKLPDVVNRVAPTEIDLLPRVRVELLRLFRDIPFARASTWTPKGAAGRGFDLGIRVRTGDKTWQLLVEVKSNVEPRIARLASEQLRDQVQLRPYSYGVLAAPYISDRVAAICEEYGLGYFDLAGNYRLVFDNAHILSRNFPNPEAERRPLKSIFSAKASRVLRVLFSDVRRHWKLKDLAKETSISIGLAYKVKERLLSLEYANGGRSGIRLRKPDELLKAWSESYSISRSKSLDLFSPPSVANLEEQLIRHCSDTRVRYALALFSGAARIAPYAQYVKGAAYVNAKLAAVAESLGWKRVDTGSNFTLYFPYDSGLLYGLQEVSGTKVVSDVQLYLDLMSVGGRGEEAAQFILEQRLRPKW